MRKMARTLLLAAVLTVACADEETDLGGETEEDAATSVTEDASLERDARADSATQPDADDELDASSAGPDASDALDAGDELDAAQMDASATPDAGLDGSAGDAGQDAGAVDAGADAGKLDASTPDAGKLDASTPDAALPDAALPDAALPDAALPDAGPPYASFSSVYAILSNNCSGCHGNSGSLNMGNKARAFDELVGGPMGPAMGLAEGQACANGVRRRVIANDPTNSLLLQKLGGSPPCGNAMPPGDTLSASELAEIRAWIVAGALNN